MGRLAGNFTVREQDIGGLFGRALVLGSYGGGAGTSLLVGGIVVGSINAWNSVFSITGYEMFSAFYGSNGFAAAGYKVVPMGVLEQAPGSVAHKIYPTGSIEGSRVIFVPMALTIGAGTTTSTYTVSYATGASISAQFTFFGLIVSTP